MVGLLGGGIRGEGVGGWRYGKNGDGGRRPGVWGVGGGFGVLKYLILSFFCVFLSSVFVNLCVCDGIELITFH